MFLAHISDTNSFSELSDIRSRREESPEESREEPRAAGASAERGTRLAVEAASGRAAGRCAKGAGPSRSARDVLAVGGGIEPPTLKSCEITKPASVRRFHVLTDSRRPQVWQKCGR